MNLREYITIKGNTAAQMLISKATKGDFAEWVKSKPKILDKIYKGRVPSPANILKDANKGDMKAMISLEHWEGEKDWKKWKKERWGE